MKKQSYIALINSKVSGIPCLIGVNTYWRNLPWKGSAHLCDSDVDFWGDYDIDYDILDRKGYKADWLVRKMSQADRYNVEAEISNYFD